MSSKKDPKQSERKHIEYQEAAGGDSSDEESDPDEETPLGIGHDMDDSVPYTDEDQVGEIGQDIDDSVPYAGEDQVQEEEVVDEPTPFDPDSDTPTQEAAEASDLPELELVVVGEREAAHDRRSDDGVDEFLQVEAAGALGAQGGLIPGEVESQEMELAQLIQLGGMPLQATPAGSAASPAPSPPPNYVVADVPSDSPAPKEPPPPLYSEVRLSKLPSYDVVLRNRRLADIPVDQDGTGVELVAMRHLDEEHPPSWEAWPAEEQEESVDTIVNHDPEASVDEESTYDSPPHVIVQIRQFCLLPKVIIAAVFLLVFLVFLIIFSISWDHVEYYQIGFKMRKTGYVFAQEAFQMGAYMIGARYTFKHYPSVAQNINFDDVQVFTSEPLRIGFNCHLQYFLRSDEIAKLERQFDKGYKDVIESISFSTIKNAASGKSLDDFVQRRMDVEQEIHRALRLSLEGDCCPEWENCIGNNLCDGCINDTSTCSKGYHVTVPFFNLLLVNLPSSILERRMRILVVALEGDEELFHMDERITRAETEKLRQRIINEADKISANATAQANLIRAKRQAEATAKLEAANNQGLTLMYNNLTITNQDHKASLHWIRTLDRHQNLISGVSFEEYIKLVRAT